MARQRTTINPTATRALSHLDRMSGVARRNVRIAQAAATIARAKEYRWQVPAEALGLREGSFLLGRRTSGDGSGGGFGVGPGWNESESRGMDASARTRRYRATASVEEATRSRGQIPELTQAMKALSRIERSVEFAAPISGANTSPTRARASLEFRLPSLADKGGLASARNTRAIRGVTPPSNVSRREFTEPSGNAGVSSKGSGRGGITINSSPTVVINGSGGGAVQHDLIGALRAHREELFDQFKRESARRERAQF